MKKIIIVATISIFIISCHSSKKSESKANDVMNSWLSVSKQELIQQNGLPIKTGGDGADGEVLVYGFPFTFHYPRTRVVWTYKFFFIDKNGLIYHWLLKKEEVPPQQLDINLFIR